MDTILWDKESDAYTKRGHEDGQKYLYRDKANRRFWVNEFLKVSPIFSPNPQVILDLGCGYGGTIHEIFDKFNNAKIIGIDPGEETLKMARENNQAPNVEFKKGHSHQIDLPDNSVDVVNLCMVLQWVPRKYLIQTIAEINRVLKEDGIVYINEFLTNRPVYSQSVHNSLVYIFKDDYAKYFTAFPWFREVYRFVYKIESGEDQQRYTAVIKKYKNEDVYLGKTSVTDIKEGSADDHFPKI